MKVTSVELHPSGSDIVVELSFRDPGRLNPYNMKAMSGLDGSDGIAPQFYGNSGSSTDAFYNMSMQKRNVVLNIALNPDPSTSKSYSDLRDDLYRMIGSSRTGQIQVQFKNNGTTVAAISGFITKVESDLTAKQPTVLLTLSAVDPMLKALDPVSVPVIGLSPGSFTISDNESTAPHGFSLTVDVVEPCTALALKDPNDRSWSFEVIPVDGFLANDELNFSSDPKDKKLYVVRGGSTIYMADLITPGSVWPIMFPGDNNFFFTNPANLVIVEIQYYPTYWGV